jgi:16S rRNA (cytosine1402-N4)-methyltransferase
VLDIQTNDTVVDATLGGAGHSRLICEKLGAHGTFVGFDLDEAAIARARVALAETAPRVELVHANFRTMATAVRERALVPTKVLFDLGWSSFQLADGRGFSFLVDEPLDMSYQTGAHTLTARAVVNSWEESSLADVIYGFGEERFARRIARAIVEYRLHKPIETSAELGAIVRSAVPAPARHGKIHPATKTFQALRIAVNDELGSLEEALTGAWEVLAPRGRIAVISFHSIEDRVIKNRFVSWEKQGLGRRITKKPIVPSREEIVQNRRARSAKLRVIEKI